MTFAADMAADLREVLADEGNTFRVALVWGSQTVYGNLSPIDSAFRVEDEGEYTDSDMQFCAVRADFSGGTLPGENTTVTVGGVKYFVTGSQTDEAGGVGAIINLRRVA